MNKKCFLAAAVLAVAGPVCAQDANTVNSDGYTETVEYSDDKYKVETNRFWSNSIRWRPTASGATGSSPWAPVRKCCSATTTSR